MLFFSSANIVILQEIKAKKVIFLAKSRCRYPCTRIIEGGDSSEAEMQVLMRAVGQGAYAVGQQTRRKGLTSETVFYKLFEAAFLGIGDGVHLAEIALLGVQRGGETEDEAGGYEVDDARGGEAVNLVVQDVEYAVAVVGQLPAHLAVVVEAAHNLGDVKAGFHVEVGEGLRGVVKDVGVLLLQQVHHLLHHPLGGEDLVGALRWYVVEDVLGVSLVAVGVAVAKGLVVVRGPRDMPPGGAVGKQSFQHLARELQDMVLVYINIVRHTNRVVVCVDAE